METDNRSTTRGVNITITSKLTREARELICLSRFLLLEVQRRGYGPELGIDLEPVQVKMVVNMMQVNGPKNSKTSYIGIIVFDWNAKPQPKQNVARDLNPAESIS